MAGLGVLSISFSFITVKPREFQFTLGCYQHLVFEVEPYTSFDIFANSVLRQIAFVTKRNPLKLFGSETCAILFQLKCCSSYFFTHKLA